VSLKKLVSMIDETEWSSLGVDIKAAAYEGLLEKAAAEGKKGAGQYFTPRVLIQSIVRCMRPDPRTKPDFTICDPAVEIEPERARGHAPCHPAAQLRQLIPSLRWQPRPALEPLPPTGRRPKSRSGNAVMRGVFQANDRRARWPRRAAVNNGSLQSHLRPLAPSATMGGCRGPS